MSESPPSKRLHIDSENNSENVGKEEKELDYNSDDNRSISSSSTASFRSAFDATHKVTRSTGKFHLLIAVTGSVAAMKLPELIAELHRLSPKDKLVVKVLATQSAKNFFDPRTMEETVYDDKDEWNMWKKRGDPVLHIELRKWADILLVAPLDANSMAKVAHGICDNLVTSVIRAWDQDKPLYFAPAMNTCMWNSPLTYQHLKTLKELLLYKEIPPIEKELMCGDKGYGAMASLQMIASIIASEIKNKFAFYSVS